MESQKKDLISVIVPVYNAQKYIGECVKSLLDQTYSNIEIILVDDGSIDSSLFICKKISCIDSRVRVFHKENGGVASARNYGIRMARGQYIGFMDNDDYIEPDMYETLLSELKKTNAAVAQILVENVDEEHHPIGMVGRQKHFIEKIPSRKFKKDLLCQKGNITCWSKLFKYEVLQDYCFIDGRWNEDVLLLYRIFSDPKYEEVVSVDKIGYHYVQRKGSYSKAGFNQGYIDNLINAAYFITQERDSELLECAYRLYFHQLIPYYLFATPEYKKAHTEQYNEMMGRINDDLSKWKNNRYLSGKERLILWMMKIFPKLFRAVLEKINYKGYYSTYK